jgi:hypothetical protein
MHRAKGGEHMDHIQTYGDIVIETGGNCVSIEKIIDEVGRTFVLECLYEQHDIQRLIDQLTDWIHQNKEKTHENTILTSTL